MPRRALALVMLFSSSLPLSAQSLDQAAARERERRETAVARPARVFTDEDLRKYVGQRPPEAASPLPSDPQPAAIGLPAQGAAPRQDAYARHLTSAESYLKQCEEGLRVAKEGWLATSEATQAGAALRARRAVESAARALEHAKEYCSQAEVAVRLAALPAGLP